MSDLEGLAKQAADLEGQIEQIGRELEKRLAKYVAIDALLDKAYSAAMAGQDATPLLTEAERLLADNA